MQTKKLLGSTLALSMLFPGFANAAELLKGLKVGGQIDLQATSARNVTDFTTRQSNAGGVSFNDRIGDAQTRVMLNADWDLLDDVHAKVTVRKNDRNYGTAGGVNANTNANSQAVDAAGILGNTFVDQAYFKIDKVFGALDMTLGRQFVGASGDMVLYLGPSDKAAYGLWTRSLDAVRADWSNEMVGVTALMGKITGHAVGIAPAGVADVDVHGLLATLKGKDTLSGGAYLYNQVTHNTGALGAPASNVSAGGKNDNLWIAGLKGKVSMGMAWAAAELAKNFGENRAINATGGFGPASKNYTGWAMKVDLGAKAETPVGALAPWAHFGYGSGDGSPNDGSNHNFTAIAPDYRPGSIYGRFAIAQGAAPNVAALGNNVSANIASASLSNRRIWGLGMKATPSALNKLTAGLSYWDYSFAARPGAGAGAGLRHIGSEADIDLTWAHSENVSLGAGVGEFWPGGYIKDTIQSTNGTALSANSQRANNPAQMGYFDVRVKF